MQRYPFLPIGIAILFLAGCQATGPDPGEDKLNIVCTTGMIGDAVAKVAGEHATVTALMGPGVDPHLYKASQGDLQKLSQADIIFFNGLHLEGKMGEVLEKIGRTKPVIAVSDGLDKSRILQLGNQKDTHDPHIWFDVQMWSDVVMYVGKSMEELDPPHAAEYRRRAAQYRDSLLELDKWVHNQLASVPKQQRVLITAHDAFNYFGRAYDIEVKGLQGISTVSEYGLKDVTDLVSFISDRKIKAVFVESSVPTKSLEAVVEGVRKRGHEVGIGGTLYSDAMGQAGTPEGEYTGMVRANVNTIVHALIGESHAEVSR